MTDYQQLEPRDVFHWFYELNQIPRGSGDEKRASDFLCKFARDRGLEAVQDAALNVIIRKPASKGYENAPAVILQGHMDMVCEKTADSQHDFSKDPIEMLVDGEMLRANKTTLGGDDGIAVAFALAILDSREIEHPALEVLITTAEETGMDGAMAIKKGQLSGKYLLNIDSEDEGVFLVSCAGGATCRFRFPAPLKKLGATEKGYRLEIKGLLGGHSGQQIKLGRGNALKILGRLLSALGHDAKFRFSEIYGGSKHNAIPNFARASFFMEEGQDVKEKLEKAAAEILNEYQSHDQGLSITVEPVEIAEAMNTGDSRRISDFLFLTPDGVQSMSQAIAGLVQTSLNTAVLERDGDNLQLTTSVRSSSLSSRNETITRLERLAGLLGVGSSVGDGYPAWEYNPNSPLRELCLKVWKEVSGKEARVEAIHAGLECGLLKEVLPDTDMISFGPDLYDVHTPMEQLRIASVKNVYDFTKALLKAMK